MTGFEIIFQDTGLLMTIAVGLIGAGFCAVLPATVALKKDEETKKDLHAGKSLWLVGSRTGN